MYLAGGAASSAQQLVQVQTNGSTNGGQVRPVSGAVLLLLEFEIHVHRYSQHSEEVVYQLLLESFIDRRCNIPAVRH